MAAGISYEAVDRVFSQLKSRNDEHRQRGAVALRQNTDAAYRELSAGQFQQLYREIIGRITQLITKSVDTHDRIGGVRALMALIDFKGDDAGEKISRFSNCLSSILSGNDPAPMFLAAQALGLLVKTGGTLTAELVNAEVSTALEWLSDVRNENRTLSAVLILRELARSSPTLMYQYVNAILSEIWTALRNPKVLIRETASEAVGECLEISSARDERARGHNFSKLYDEMNRGFAINTTDSVHGSLLVIKQLLLKSSNLMNGTRYRDACDVVFRFKESKDAMIKKEVLSIIPTLAGYAPEQFTNNYLHMCMLWLQNLLDKRIKDNTAAFVTMGNIALAVKSNIIPYVDGMLNHVRDALLAKARNKQIDEAPIFECLSMVANAVEQALSKYIPALMDPMFSVGLTDSLTQALVDMAYFVPPSKPIIQEKLLDLLSRVLCGRPFMPLGSPYHTHARPQIWTRDHKDPQVIAQRESEIALALDTLGSFDFTGHSLNEFVRDVAIKYVDADNPEIRKAAALTCCQLFVRDPIVHHTSQHAIQVVADVIERLLAVSISDLEAEIRRTVLMSLDARFDRHLGKAENVRMLFLAVHDEIFPIREAAMAIIGRLTSINPAYVFPSLRKLLIQLLTEVDHSGSPRLKEQGAKLISHLVGASSTLIKPYVTPIVEVLLPKAQHANPEVSAATLEAIGDLSVVGGEDMRRYIPDLMSIIIESLQDLSSNIKRIAALHALSKLAHSAGYVIEPYKDYPELLVILKNIVRSEDANELRRETVKLMGILGAIDPDEQQKISEQSPESNLVAEAQAVTDVSLIMQGITPSNEEYYPTVVINTLMGLLKDTSLSQYHQAVIEAVMNIYATMGLRCVPFLNQVIPGFLSVIHSAASTSVHGYFNQLSLLVRIVRQHIRPFLPEILKTVKEFWDVRDGTRQATILSLIEAIARSLEGEFKVHLAEILPLMLGILESDNSPSRAPSLRVLHAFLVFGSSAEEYMHLIVPVVVKMFDKPGQPHAIRIKAIETLGRLSKQVNISEFAVRIIHPLMRVLQSRDENLRKTAMDTLNALIYQLGPDFVHFVPMVNKVLQTNRIEHKNYSLIVSKLQRNEPLPQDLSPDEQYGDDDDENQMAEIHSKKFAVNQQHLKAAWNAESKSTREDWMEWMRRFSVELLRESPQQALRACTPLASVYGPVARSLFNSAFISCWTELYDQYQEELVRAIETALTADNTPPEILHILLNLAEFMEHNDQALPIDVRALGLYAAKCHAFAKALHYKELEFHAEQNPSAVEALISINNQLQQYDAAFGILRKAKGYHDVELKESWFEKLFRWEDALKSYQKREQQEGESFETTIGKMRCLHAQGEWESLSSLAQNKWSNASIEVQKTIAQLAASAAWGLGEWDLMDNYLSIMKNTSPDKSFFAAILAIHRHQFEDANMHIDNARSLIETELSALLGESYDRAYLQMLRIQMLAELEEIIEYKRNLNNPEKLAVMIKTWMKRLQGCQPNPEVWQRMLKVRALVISPKDNLQMWIKFTNLCRKNNRASLALKSLNSLIDAPPGIRDIGSYVREHLHEIPYPVSYAALKYEWAVGAQDRALDSLKAFSSQLADDIQIRSRAAVVNGTAAASVHALNGVNGVGAVNGTVNGLAAPAAASLPKDTLGEEQRLLAKCYLKQGEWQTELHDGEWHHDQVQDILTSYRYATQYNSNWYKAWHAWALANFEVVTSMTSARDREATEVPPGAIQEYVVPAITGFFKSISLSSTSSLQDALRLLTLWFAHGGHTDVNNAVNDGVATVSVDTWLEVIPQLLARINQPNQRVKQSIHKLLMDLGRAHPQALVFPLTVAVNSDTARRSLSAQQMMEAMRSHSLKLVEQAELVSRELIRIAVLWHEQWHEGLEEASRLYFGDKNIEGMFAVLEPLHNMLEKGPDTLREMSFIQSFGRELQEAYDWCTTFKQSNDRGDLNQAWDLYYQVFRKIARQLPSLLTLELQYVSPRLKAAENLDLAVPGTYRSGNPVVRIASFNPVATVMVSKQRPRQLMLKGSDGVDYMYLLKGHEDIRQDERVMQLFGLCNTLLENDNECRKRHLKIQRYSAIPLSTQSGLLGWVPNSDTLHVLIREYRHDRKILLNIEHRIMLQMAPDYDSLTLMQKVEVFGYALDNTTGQDLYRVLWLKSKSSEAWLGRRSNYTRSLAVMSMVGYVLGLGDRHPSNIMLDRITGNIVHVDFGDCFEIAQHRDKYPERVQFRLTRMLTYAMEVSNIEGSYRTTCEHVMRVLRQNKESVMAVLEAFIHDPLLTWRLNNRESPHETSFTSERRASIIGTDPTAATMSRERPGEASFRPRNRSSAFQQQQMNTEGAREIQNARALQVLSRVKEKLTGRVHGVDLKVDEQVDALIKEATNLENLCQHYIGWCSFW